jgi:LEA14-like dessication related protein
VVAAGCGLLLAIVACGPPRTSEITSATPIADVFGPRFELDAEATAIERFDPPGAGAGLGLALAARVRNPNDFAIVIERIEYTLRLRDEVVASGVVEPGLALAPNASADVSWRIDADLTGQRNLWRPVVEAFAGVPVPFSVDGSVRFATQTYAFTTGVRRLVEGGVLARQAVSEPRLTLDGRQSRLTVVRADAPVVRLELLASNAGDVGYFLTGRALELELNDEVVATLDLGPVPVPAGETSRVDLVFIIDRGRLAAPAAEALAVALRGERGSVRVRGAFAYDVLGVDSYPVRIGDGLTTTLPPSQLPRLDVPPEDDGAAAEPSDEDAEEDTEEGADDDAEEDVDEDADEATDSDDDGASDGDDTTAGDETEYP